MEKETLLTLLKQNKSLRQLEKEIGINHRTIGYYVKKYNLTEFLIYKKPIYHNDNYFNKIDTKEKAYILGFVIGDGYLIENMFQIELQLRDKPILDYIQKYLNCNVVINNKIDVKKKIFPKASVYIGNKQILNSLKMQFGGFLKKDRRLPIIPKELEKYMLLGFFDAEGCITWGKRKDRNRIWHKVSFTSQINLLIGIQNILLKYDISTKIYPKKDSNCFVLEFSNKEDVLKFCDIIYTDLIVLNRKYNKVNALRLELGEFGGNLEKDNTEPRLIIEEGVETTCNDRLENPSQ